MFATDFPHIECDWPNTRPFAERLFAGVPADEAFKIAAGNMLAFFHSRTRRWVRTVAGARPRHDRRVSASTGSTRARSTRSPPTCARAEDARLGRRAPARLPAAPARHLRAAGGGGAGHRRASCSGTLLANPVNRHPTVTASSIATIDELAPGRTLLGWGIGDTAVRLAGLRPARVEELEAARG